jgi:hypothetical protein
MYYIFFFNAPVHEFYAQLLIELNGNDDDVAVPALSRRLLDRGVGDLVVVDGVKESLG